MLFLLDTNAVSDYTLEHARIEANLAAMLPGDSAALCTIVRGEILFGVNRLPLGKKRDDLRQRADKILSGLQCFAVPETAGDHYSVVKIATQLKGFTFNDNDLWIAATALTLGATLVTRDKDFSHVPGLIRKDWSV